MSTESNDNAKPENEPHPRPISIEELRRRAICKKRYGRATLTIRRWGGFSDLLAGNDLTKKLNGFRAGEATAEEVAWAFARARIESHSPTFQWKDADLGRLIKLVTDCSESPHFVAKTPDELAAELVKAQDKEREQLKHLTGQFAESFAGIGNFSKLLQPQLTKWAADQQKLFAGLQRSFVTPALSKQLAEFAAPSIQQQMKMVGLSAGVRKAMLPTLQPGINSRLALGMLPRQTLLAQRVRLPDSLYGTFTKSLRESLGTYNMQTLTPALAGLARHQSFSIGEVVSAAREAAELAEQQGERKQAQTLATLTAEVVEVFEAPSVEKLQQMVGDLSEQLNGRLDELQEQQAASEEKRQSDRKDDLTLTVFLWVLAAYLAVFIWMLDQMPK